MTVTPYTPPLWHEVRELRDTTGCGLVDARMEDVLYNCTSETIAILLLALHEGML